MIISFQNEKISIEKTLSPFGSMKLYFMVHHIETSNRYGNVIVKFSERDGDQVSQTVPCPSSSERWNASVISFTFDDTRDKLIDIKLIDSDSDVEIATLPLPLSICPFDFRVNAKFLMDPLTKKDEVIKIFLMIHLSTFGQSPFHAKKGLLVKHLKDATRKKCNVPEVHYPNEQLMMKLNSGLDELPSVIPCHFHAGFDHSHREGTSCLLESCETEWAV